MIVAMAGRNSNFLIQDFNWYIFKPYLSVARSLNAIFTSKISYMKKNLLKKIANISFPVLLFIMLASFIDKKADPKTVTGEILDMKCYMTSGERGDGHKDCAAMCLKGGAPMGILADDGKVYLLIEGKNGSAAFEEAKKHAGETITVTGTLSEKNGVQALIITEVKAKK